MYMHKYRGSGASVSEQQAPKSNLKRNQKVPTRYQYHAKSVKETVVKAYQNEPRCL